MNKIIDGKIESAKILQHLKQKIESECLNPRLAIILIGDDEASDIYVEMKSRKGLEIGVIVDVFRFKAQTPEKEILKIISELNSNSDVNGIIIQLPLPQHLNAYKLISSVDPKKDVDGFHPYNYGMMSFGAPVFIPCTPLGCMKLIEVTGTSLDGKTVTVIGRSMIVGKPMASLLLQSNATVIHCHSHTQNLKQLTQISDVIVSATGCVNMIDKSFIKKDVVIIDVGIKRVNGKIFGDVNFEDVYEDVKFITPVPGGVGPMTVAFLLSNTVKACTL